MSAIDFFAGVGGFTEGARRACVSVALAANHDADAVEWHRRNHPEVRHVQQDLGELDMRALPESDLLLASPCCQGFSPSGRPGQPGAKRLNRERLLAKRQVARNTSYAVLAAADVVRPRAIVVENVVEMMAWEAFGAWCGVLEALGYHVTARRLNAADYGSPQSRERMILVAHQERAVELAPALSVAQRAIGDVLLDDDDPRCRWVDLASKTASIQERIQRARRGARRFLWANVDSARARAMDESLPTVTTRSLTQMHVVDGDWIRRLEAREVARAMSFPDSYQIPDGRVLAGRLLGNAIDCRLAEGVVAQVVAA